MAGKKTAIVTRASQGIGASLVKAFLKEVYNVIATSRDVSQSFTTSPNLVLIDGDIGKQGIATKCIEAAIRHFGTIDVLVNNAGIFRTKPFTDFTIEDSMPWSRPNCWDLYITQLAVQQMLKQKSGNVVTFSASLADQPVGGIHASVSMMTEGKASNRRDNSRRWWLSRWPLVAADRTSPCACRRLDRRTTSLESHEYEGRKKMTAKPDGERFQSDAQKYAAYLETPEGRLRSDLAFANLQDFLPLQAKPSLCALDLGGGTGATAVRLARLGIHVTLLDSSRAMLDIANRTALDAGVTEKIALKEGDAAQLENLFRAGSFDVILCHNILEYVDDPDAVMCSAARALRDSSAIVSVLVRNRAGEVFKAAILGGDLAAAENNLTAKWGQESLYGGKARLFTSDSLQAVLKAASLAMIAERGVRVFADYLPPQVSRSAEYERILVLERKLGSRPEFAAVARYKQYFAQRANLPTKDGA